MKRLLILSVAACALAACATDPPVATATPPPAATAVASMVTGCAGAIKDIVATSAGDAASKVAAVSAIERLCGGGSGGGTSALAVAFAPPPPPASLGATLWTAALQVADVGLRAYGLKMTRDVAVVQSNNQAQTTIASYGAFTTLGQSIASAGTAGYPYVQAPGATTTITNTSTNTSTLSGTGVLGSGTYTGPVARTCSGGGAGNGAGTTTGAPGGAGGSASC